MLLISANEDTPQVYAACGRGPRSTLRVLRHGLEVTEMAVSELPGNPNAVWTVKKRADGNFSTDILLEIINEFKKLKTLFLFSDVFAFFFALSFSFFNRDRFTETKRKFKKLSSRKAFFQQFSRYIPALTLELRNLLKLGLLN